MTKTVPIDKLAPWSEPKRVETRQGPRMLRTARPTSDFWGAWKADKASLKAAGVSCGKNQGGEWEARWWLPLDAEEQQRIDEAQQASRATDADIDIPHPDGLEYLPFQRAGIAYCLDRPNVLMADSMGLGKTIEAIGVYNADPSIAKVVVVCPASLRLNWQREFERWAVNKWGIEKTRIEVVTGGKPSDYPRGKWDVLILNYDVLQKHRARLDRDPIDLLIVDEVHYCKSQKAQRTRAIFGWKTKEGVIKQHPIQARRKLFLTGTPIVNRPIELWSLVESLDPTDMGRNFFRFAKRYTQANYNGYGWDFSGADRLDELQRKMRERFMVRRLKSDVLKELPPKRRQVIEVPANGCVGAIEAEQSVMSRYEGLKIQLQEATQRASVSSDPKDFEQAIANLKEGMSEAFTEMSRVRHETALAKVPMIVEHLESALEGGPVVVFAHHKDVIQRIMDAFPDRSVKLTGDTPMAERQAVVDDFQAGKVDLFVGNIQAAGVGITLTRSSHVVFAELDWVPGNLTQAEDRTHRIGQAESVLVQHLVLEGSLDAVMAETIVVKQEVIDAALDRKPVESPSPSPSPAGTVQANPGPLSVEVEVDEEEEKITEDQIRAAHEGLKRLAGNCDGARALDGHGFNQRDTGYGKKLAYLPTLSRRQALHAIKMVNRYRRQLPLELVARAKGESK